MPDQLSSSNAAFVPFFLGSAVSAIVSTTSWALVYLHGFPLPLPDINPFYWHAHQMIYGYAMAVIAGFLLTVVESWTGRAAAGRSSIAALLLLWILARVFFLAGHLLLAAILDLSFVLWLSAAITLTIVRTSQWRQMAVVSKLILLGLGNLVFYLGAAAGTYWGIFGGLYLVLGLILTMARRLFPAFVEEEEPINSPWLDRASLIFFLAFFVAELARAPQWLSAGFAFGVALVNGARLLAWHRPLIWQRNLLWSFYISMWMIVAGFLMFAVAPVLGWSQSLALHAMAFGGIGLVTLSMMWRLFLEHFGRSGSNSFSQLLAFGVLILGALLRVVLPLLWPEHYPLWILLSLLCWISAFAIFALASTAILLKNYTS